MRRPSDVTGAAMTVLSFSIGGTFEFESKKTEDGERVATVSASSVSLNFG